MLRPWISTNLAISADGKISSVNRRPSGWTSPDDHQRLLALRRGVGALMVGHGTLQADRMTLTVAGTPTPPLRCIVSNHGQLDPNHPVFSKHGGAIHILCTRSKPAEPLDQARYHVATLADFLRTLREELGIERLHCEGGGELIRSLAEIDAIDEFHLTLAGHAIFGGFEAPTSTGPPGPFLSAARAFELSAFEPVPGVGECFLSYIRRERLQ